MVLECGRELGAFGVPVPFVEISAASRSASTWWLLALSSEMTASTRDRKRALSLERSALTRSRSRSERATTRF